VFGYGTAIRRRRSTSRMAEGMHVLETVRCDWVRRSKRESLQSIKEYKQAAKRGRCRSPQYRECGKLDEVSRKPRSNFRGARLLGFFIARSRSPKVLIEKYRRRVSGTRALLDRRQLHALAIYRHRGRTLRAVRDGSIRRRMAPSGTPKPRRRLALARSPTKGVQTPSFRLD